MAPLNQAPRFWRLIDKMAVSVIHSVISTLSHVLNMTEGDQDSACCDVPAAAAVDGPAVVTAHAAADALQQEPAAQLSRVHHSTAASGPPPPLLTILSTKAELLNRTLTHVEVVARARPSADAVFGLVADPSNHTEIFDPIEVRLPWRV